MRCNISVAGLEDGPRAAIEHFEEALTRLSRTTAPGVRAGLLADRASKLAELHRLSAARDQYQAALNLWRRTGDQRNLTETSSSLGNVLVGLGEFRQAERLLREVLERRRAQGDRAGEGVTLSVLGNLYWRTGEFSKALQARREALEIAQRENLRDIEFKIQPRRVAT